MNSSWRIDTFYHDDSLLVLVVNTKKNAWLIAKMKEVILRLNFGKRYNQTLLIPKCLYLISC